MDVGLSRLPHYLIIMITIYPIFFYFHIFPLSSNNVWSVGSFDSSTDNSDKIRNASGVRE